MRRLFFVTSPEVLAASWSYAKEVVDVSVGVLAEFHFSDRLTV